MTDISSARRARKAKRPRRLHQDPALKVIAAQRIKIARLENGQREIMREFAAIRQRIGPPIPLAVVFAPQQALAMLSPPLAFPDARESMTQAPVIEPVNPVTASLPVITESPIAPKPNPLQGHRVFPCTCTQRGQWNDRRPTHRHAGIDMGGREGSPIVAAIGGVVLPKPGGDRGYGPLVAVIRGRDNVVYRYAHMRKLLVHEGQKVETGQQIGTMGARGAHGFVHLHFEAIPISEYRHRPYGLHSLDPNKLLGGERGAHMAAGEAMKGGDAVVVASITESGKSKPRKRTRTARK